jgi:hypothetical protein
MNTCDRHSKFFNLFIPHPIRHSHARTPLLFHVVFSCPVSFHFSLPITGSGHVRLVSSHTTQYACHSDPPHRIGGECRCVFGSMSARIMAIRGPVSVLALMTALATTTVDGSALPASHNFARFRTGIFWLGAKTLLCYAAPLCCAEVLSRSSWSLTKVELAIVRGRGWGLKLHAGLDVHEPHRLRAATRALRQNLLGGDVRGVPRQVKRRANIPIFHVHERALVGIQSWLHGGHPPVHHTVHHGVVRELGQLLLPGRCVRHPAAAAQGQTWWAAAAAATTATVSHHRAVLCARVALHRRTQHPHDRRQHLDVRVWVRPLCQRHASEPDTRPTGGLLICVRPDGFECQLCSEDGW